MSCDFETIFYQNMTIHFLDYYNIKQCASHAAEDRVCVEDILISDPIRQAT